MKCKGEIDPFISPFLSIYLLSIKNNKRELYIFLLFYITFSAKTC